MAGRLAVLLVDDDPGILDVGRRMITFLGHEAQTASGGSQALDLLEHGRFDLVLIDRYMPGMDGPALARRIREEDIRGRDGSPLFLVSLSGSAGRTEETRAAGMDAMLDKPLELTNLQELFSTLKPGQSSPAPSPAPADKDSAVLLDEARLAMVRDLRGDGDSDLLAEVTAMYGRSGRRNLEDMDRALAAGDARALERAAHSLKSGSANLGARELAALCADIEETAARDKDLAPLADKIARARDLHGRVLQALIVKTEATR